jgi:tetratricopeptide (TPR) repeat protein
LVTEPVPDGFAVHDLLRDYAAELAEAEETSAARRAAVHRALDHYLHTARHCAEALGRAPQVDEAQLSLPQADVTLERFATASAALEWFNRHQPLLTAVVTWSADHGFDSHCWQLPSCLRSLFDHNGHWQAMADTQELALQAARRLEDRPAEGMALRTLGYACGRMGDYRQAGRHFQLAAEIFQSAGTARDRATSHRGLAWVLGMDGRHDEAMAHAQRAMNLSRDAALADQAHALNTVGRCHAYLGAYQPAVLNCRQALALHQQEGNRMGQAEAWYSLGLAHQGAGQAGESARAYQQALELFGELGDRHYIGETLAGLGDAHQALGDRARAVSLWRRALGILADIRHPDTGRVRAQLGATVPALAHAPGVSPSSFAKKDSMVTPMSADLEIARRLPCPIPFSQ